MLEKCVLTVLELNWNKRFGHKKTKLNICHHMLTSSTQLQNRSFHLVERTRTSSKCLKMKYARAKRAKILFSIVKYVNLWGFCCRRRRGCLSSLLSIATDLACAQRRNPCNTSGITRQCYSSLQGTHLPIYANLLWFSVSFAELRHSGPV